MSITESARKLKELQLKKIAPSPAAGTTQDSLINLVPMTSFLGKRLIEKDCLAFLESLGKDLEIDSFADYTLLIYKNSGVLLYITPTDHIFSIQLYANGYDSYAGFSGQLPARLKFSDNRDTVLEKLGTPTKPYNMTASNEPRDSFTLEGVLMNVRYVKDLSAIAMVSLTDPHNN